MNIETTIYRRAALAIGLSIATQIIQAIALASPDIGGWFIGLAALVLIAIGIATFLRFQLSQWLLDGTAIAVGIAGGFWL